MKKSISTVLSLLLLLSAIGCNQAEVAKQRENKKDSLVKDSIRKDSIRNSNIEVVPRLSLGDKSIVVLKPLSLSKRVKVEISENTYMYHDADRFQHILNMRVSISSKSKAKEYTNFLPEFTAYQIDNKQHLKKINKLTINLYKKSDRSFFAIEDVFDFKEKETFVLWLALEQEIKGKIVVCATKGGDDSFKSSQIIGSIIKK